MPRVPVYNSQTVQEAGGSVQPFQRAAQFSPVVDAANQALVRVGQETARTTEIFSRIQQQRQIEADRAEAMEAYSAFSGGIRDRLDGDGGVYSQRGSNTRGLAQSFGSQYDEDHNKVSRDLSSEGAKNVFSSLTRRHRESTLNAVSRFESREFQAYRQQAGKALVETSINDAIASFNDPEALADAFSNIQTAIDSTAAGKPADLVALELADAKNRIHSGVLDRLIESDVNAAQVYYDENKGEINAVTQTGVEKKLDTASADVRVQEYVDQIDFGGTKESEALSQAREDLEGKDRDYAVQRIKIRYAEAETARKEAYDRAHDAVLSVYNNGGRLDDVTPAQWSALKETDETRLRGAFVARAQGSEPTTNIDTWHALNSLDPEELRELDLSRFTTQLSQADFKRFANKQQKILDGSHIEGTLTADKIIANANRRLGYGGNGKSDAKKQYRFTTFVHSRVRAHEEQTGQSASTDDVARIVEDSILTVETDDGWFFGDDKRIFEIEVPGVAPSKIASIARMLDENDIAASPENIAEYASAGSDIEIGGIPRQTINDISAQLKIHGHEVNKINVLKFINSLQGQ